MIRSTDPSKNVSKKFHDKAAQSYIVCLNLNKINQVFHNEHINKVTPRFTFMRRAQNVDTPALTHYRLSQNSSSSAPVLYWLSHLTRISSLKAKNVDFHLAKNIQIQLTVVVFFLAIFRRILIK